MKTTILNLHSGPGSGKSTTALGLTSVLKQNNILVEYVSEYAKDIVWGENTELLKEQYLIFAEQLYRQMRLIGKVKYVITDCPLIMQIPYITKNKNYFLTKKFEESLENILVESYNMFNNVDIFIERKKAYQPVGRMQTEEEARLLDKEIYGMMVKHCRTIYTTDSINAIPYIINWLNFGFMENIKLPDYGSNNDE
jgi:hypothetical protein